MKITGPATEDDVITAFLEAELYTKRHNDDYGAALKELSLEDIPEGFLTRATFADDRRQLLAVARGWPDKKLFKDFPAVAWQKAVLEPQDIVKLDYIHYSYWDELSQGSHRITDGAASVKAGVTPYEMPNTSFWKVADLARENKVFPPLVALEDEGNGRFTLVEGHTRATGFALAGVVPAGQAIIIGKSLGKNLWSREEKS